MWNSSQGFRQCKINIPWDIRCYRARNSTGYVCGPLSTLYNQGNIYQTNLIFNKMPFFYKTLKTPHHSYWFLLTHLYFCRKLILIQASAFFQFISPNCHLSDITIFYHTKAQPFKRSNSLLWEFAFSTAFVCITPILKLIQNAKPKKGCDLSNNPVFH